MGGTCNGSLWRDRLVPLLLIESFNPVVEDWTEECMQQEIDERADSDFCLYTITPKMTGVFSIAEVVDDSNKRPEKTIMVILEQDEDAEFSEAQLKSLSQVARMVQANGGRAFRSLEDAAKHMNSRTYSA